ncbi:MAG: chemotaxis protein CheB [Luteimonas sp.]
MAEPAPRVALLARPGAACDNLQAALRQLGADLVAVQDPGEGDPAALAAARPAAVLIALEPAVEDALDRYDVVLAEPGRLVIYDEVAVAARREGWDAARWTRHLAAKLGGHADVLPPGAGSDDAGAGAGALSLEAMDLAPMATGPSDPEPPRADQSADPEPQAFASAADTGIDLDDGGASHEAAIARAGDGIDFGGFTPEMMAIMASDAPAIAEPPAPEARDSGPEAEPALEPGPRSEPEPASGLALDPAPEPMPQAAPAAEPGPTRLRAEELSLVDMEPGGVERAPSTGFHGGLEEGGVVVLAGIGGPDAVRQFLVGVPAGFARPIIVRQRLDGGRHDRLVRQMQRATALPVELAEAGRPLVAGHVYILPDGMTTVAGEGAPTFAATDAAVPVLAGLPASDSVVLVLSGSDPAVVPEILDAARQGAVVAGQSPDESFDGSAAAALAAAGNDAHPAAELARRVSTRWLSLKD